MFQSMSDAVFGTSTPATTDSKEFDDAKAEEVDSDLTFDVSAEEVSLIRADIASAYPEDYTFLSNDYISSVASKPYSKDPTKRRPIEYTTSKLKDLMKWREENAVHLQEMYKLIPGETTNDSATDDVENAELATKAQALATSLNYASMYWHGLDKKGRPVLWIRTNRMPWYPDVEAQVNALILLADAGIKLMPEGITDFVVVSDSNSPPPPNPQFMMNLLSALVKGYPDRLYELISCPVGSIIQFVMKLLLPLMPSRLASKIILIGEEETKEKLSSYLLNGKDDIPTFLNGTADHDLYYPKDGAFPDKTLTFDYKGMIERLEVSIKEYKPVN
mmetsp:Transcript_2483/g.3548  ORF Transcript_2483/g.3548 Transcript_2483/m.3548 type:complete len:332 (+) Transcript_2483:98-1093(+)